MNRLPQQTPLSLDNLRWLLCSLALVLLPMFFYLKPWIPAFALLLGLWRHHIAIRRRPLPRLRILLPMTMLSAVAVAGSHGGSFSRDASVGLLLLMMAMKLMESNNRRDATLLAFLAWFLSLTTFLFTQSLFMGAYLALPTVALAVTLIGLSHPNGTLPVTVRLRLSIRMLLQAVPLMLVLFVLFPRLSGPLWRMPSDATSALTGLSDSMAPGSIGELSLSDEIAFRVQFQGPPPAQNQLYWRGPVFWQFDGRTWRPGIRTASLPQETLADTADAITYSVTLEPHNRTWLFALDMSGAPPSDSKLTQDRQLLSRLPVSTRIRYQAHSFLSYRLQPQIDPETRKAALQLPANSNPRTLALGREWAATGATPEAIAQRALDMFRQQAFVYTLAPPALGRDGVDEFLFSTRRGFCEHYAGSFVVLMRAAGIPARIVTGYQGGRINPLAGYMIVRQSDAHAWAEIWLENRGWTRIDPTAAVSPQRIELGLAGALSGDEQLPLLARGDYGWLQNVFLGWDAINNGWNQWVLGYNQQRQMELLTRLLGSEISVNEMAGGMVAAIVLVMLSIGWHMLRDNTRTDPLQDAYLKFLRKLARTGVVHSTEEGPLEFGMRASNGLPLQAQAITRITGLYARLRYGGKYDPQQLEQLKREIKDFRT